MRPHKEGSDFDEDGVEDDEDNIFDLEDDLFVTCVWFTVDVAYFENCVPCASVC